MFRCTYTLVAGAALALVAALPAAAVAEDAAHLTVRNGSVECWGADGASTLWHFLVFNDGTKRGKYTVEYRRDADDELTTYTEAVAKKSGVNDGLVIPPGGSIDYVRISTQTQGTIFLRSGVTGSPRCG